MSFKLSIECSKDIDQLHIDFSDGSSSVIETPKKETLDVQDSTTVAPDTPRHENFLNTDDDFSNISQEIIKPPVIEDVQRTVNVAKELQNLDL